MKTKIAFIIGIISLLALILGGCRPHSPEERAEYAAERVTSYLELDESQQAELNRIKNDWIESHQQVRQMHKEVMEEALLLLEQDSISDEEFNALVDKVKAHIMERVDSHANHLREFHATLTPEQRQKAVEKLRDFKENMERWHH